MQLDYTIKSYPSTKVDHLSMFIKSLKMKRSQYARDVQKSWKAEDCLHDPNIEFFCNGRLPVFNEWDSENAKQVREDLHCAVSRDFRRCSSFERFGPPAARSL